MVKDVLDWAVVRGDINLAWKDFAGTVERERLANEDAMEIDDAALDEASIAFRYEHDLITAEETERWLGDRGLTLSEFSEYFGRRYWGRIYPGEVPSLQSQYHSASPAEKDLFLIDLTLSGELDRMADRLSWRIAAHTEAPVDDAATPADQCDAAAGVPDIDAPGLSERLTHLGRDREWLAEVARWEMSYQARIRSLVTAKELQQELISMRLMLTRFEIEMIEVDTRDAAAEVVACVRSDGMEMAEVAEESRYPFHRSEVLLEDLAPELQQQFVSVKPGALLEPITREDSFEVCRVKTRIDPKLDDSAIRQRLEQRIVERHFSELVSKHINWRILQPISE